MDSNLLRRLPSALLLAAFATLAVFLVLVQPVLAQPAAADLERWTPIGPDGSEIASCVADPDVPGTLYAGTQGGGVWTSLDGGASWAPTPEGLGAADVSSLAVSAGRIYAGNYYSINVLADGADSWRQVGPSLYGVQELAVDPAHPEWIWMTGDYLNDGLLLSQDGGEHWSWKLRLAEPFRSLVIAPTVPPTVYAASNEGIFVGTGVGATWRQLSPGFPALWNEIELAVDATDAETIYASTAYSGFWKTTDAGAHWNRVGDVAPRPLLALAGALLGFGGDGLMRSEDGGGTWEAVPLHWWEIFCLTADPTVPAGAWLGIGRGFLHTSDGGRTWVRSGSRTPRATHVQAFAFDPFRPRTLYTSTLEPVPGSFPRAKLQRSTDAGASWSKPLTPLNVRSLTADPRRPGTLYAGTPRGISVSRDRGTHWQRVLSSSGGVATVVADPKRPGTLWAGGYGLWRSQDAGGTWARLPDPLDRQSFSAARRIYLSPWSPADQPETVYLIDFYLDGFDVPGALWRSTDGGSTWEAIEQNDPVALAFDPTTPGLLYLADFFGYLQRSRDGGTTWELVASAVGGDHLTTLLLDPLDPSVLYVGTSSAGVWRSRDQGVTWEPLYTGMIAPAITCLEADPHDPHHLVACTKGGGLLEIQTSSEP